MCTHDFLKLVLADEKKLLKMSEVKHVNVPMYDELSVKNLWPIVKADEEVMMYLPNEFPKGRVPDRAYTFNVLNTVRTEYVQGLIKHAQSLRNSTKDNGMQAEYIKMTPEWQQQLEAIPFISSKIPHIVTSL